MRVWLDLALIGLADHWKLAAGAVTILIVVVIGTLLMGILGSDTAAADLTPTATVKQPTAIPEAVSDPPPTAALIVAPTQSPTAVPTPAPEVTDPLVMPASVNVPIYLTDAKNIGSLEFVLTYDPAVLEVSDVEAGGLAQNACATPHR